jgi:hypothetical protein
MVWWYRLSLTPNLSTRAFWQPPVLCGGPVSRDIFGASRRMDEENKNLVCAFPWFFKISLMCRKILRRGTSGFTYHPKEVLLRIFVALKNLSHWPGSNLRPLGPVASTLTTIPPRRWILPYWTETTKRRNLEQVDSSSLSSVDMFLNIINLLLTGIFMFPWELWCVLFPCTSWRCDVCRKGNFIHDRNLHHEYLLTAIKHGGRPCGRIHNYGITTVLADDGSGRTAK